jgi:hypothetical protein
MSKKPVRMKKPVTLKVVSVREMSAEEERRFDALLEAWLVDWVQARLEKEVENDAQPTSKGELRSPSSIEPSIAGRQQQRQSGSDCGADDQTSQDENRA